MLHCDTLLRDLTSLRAVIEHVLLVRLVMDLQLSGSGKSQDSAVPSYKLDRTSRWLALLISEPVKCLAVAVPQVTTPSLESSAAAPLRLIGLTIGFSHYWSL